MRTNRVLLLSAILVAALAAAGFASPQGPRVVRIAANEHLNSLFPSWMSSGSTAGGEPDGLLLRDDDLLLGGSGAVPCRASDGRMLQVVFGSWCARLPGRIVSASLDEDSTRSWLAGAGRSELAGLRLLVARDSLGADALQAARRLAAVNPNAGLWALSRTAFRQLLPLFRPRLLILTDFAPDLRGGAEARLGALELLVVSGSDSGSFAGLPPLPRLRRLAISEWNPGKAGPLPAGMAGLKSLLVLGGRGFDGPSALRAVPSGLEELSLLQLEGPVDITLFANRPGLRTLVLDGSEISGDPAGLARLAKLQWLGLPANTSQQQFAAIVTAHPGLQVLEVPASGGVTDLSPLRGLRRLEGLALVGRPGTLEVPGELRSLRYVGMEADTTAAARARLASLRKSLPEALVIASSTNKLCLGSGWILLLVPAVAVSWYLARRARRRTVAGVHAA